MGADPAADRGPQQPEPASGAPAKPILAVWAAATLGAAPFVPHWLNVTAALGLGAGSLALGRAGGAWAQVAVAIAAALVTVGWTVPALTSVWPAHALLALAVAMLVVMAVDGTRSFSWARRGRLDAAVLCWTALVVVAAPAALVLWYVLLRPTLHGLGFPAVPPALLVVAVVAWSIVNAAAEETLFRGLLLEALRVPLGDVAAVMLQAAAFGLIHFSGIPGGWAGVVLAAIYGGMLGALRLRAGGMLAVIVAHVSADLTIVALLRGLVG